MAEATQEQQQGHEGEQDGDGEGEGRVPYARFEEVVKARKAAETRLQEIEERLLEHENQNKSETERERIARERAEQRAAELETKVTGLEKGAWVRSAAAELKFHDPEDAVTYLQSRLAGIEDEREAKRLVRDLAKRKSHLVQEEKQEARPNLQTVFAGQQTNGAQQQPQMTPAQRAAQQEVEFAQGLAGELGKFRERWTDMPGGWGS